MNTGNFWNFLDCIMSFSESVHIFDLLLFFFCFLSCILDKIEICNSIPSCTDAGLEKWVRLFVCSDMPRRLLNRKKLLFKDSIVI